MIKKQPSSKETFQVFSKRLIFPAVCNNNNTIRDKKAVFLEHIPKRLHMKIWEKTNFDCIFHAPAKLNQLIR